MKEPLDNLLTAADRNIREVVREYLKEKLEIDMTTSHDESRTITIRLDGEELCSKTYIK